MLDVKGLSRYYGDFLAVDDVSFSIGKGEIVGLLGHNGAGKTTVMKMLSGYLEPSAGHITINGLDVEDNTKAVQKILGYLPESLPIYQEMSVADYLDFAAELKGLQGEIKAAEIRRVVQQTEIESRILDPIANLSRGLKQRVGVAQAILGKPSLLILDEPTNGLDPVQTGHMRSLIRELAKNATVMISTHIMQEVEAVCDRVLIVKSGKLVIDEKLEALKESRELEITTSMTEKVCRVELAGIQGVREIAVLTAEGEGGVQDYRITLDDGAVLAAAAGAIAHRVVTSGADLYRLEPVRRNLETLFREVSESVEGEDKGEGIDHAA